MVRKRVLMYGLLADFTQPYRVITPTLEGPILRALAEVTTPLTRSQIVALVEEASEAGVRKALARLVEQGIVIEHRLGKRYAYVANRAHLLWPSVEGLFSARHLLRERVEGVVARWALPPASVELFGSMARGGSDASSDIDLLIVRPDLNALDEETWDAQVADLRDQVVRWTGNACDIVVLGPGELEKAHDDDEPILRPPTSNLAGAPLAALLAQPRGSLAHAARVMAGNAAAQAQLEALSQQASTVAACQQQIRTSFAAIEAHVAGARRMPLALRGKLEALRPVLELDTAALQAAARALGASEALGVARGPAN